MNKTGKGGFKENPQNRNNKGAPKRGQSWAELINFYGNMTPVEAAEHASKIASKLKQYGDGITLKEAVVLRSYAALLFEPTSSLLNSFMDRADGKVQEKLDLTSGNQKITTVEIVYADRPSLPAPSTDAGQGQQETP